jgi:SAGA-associated factor 29
MTKSAAVSMPNNKPKGSRKYSQRYPRGVSVDFRTLSVSTQLSYIGHYGIPISAEAPPSELGVAVAQHFETVDINEEQAIGGFLARLEVGGNDDPKPPPSPGHAAGGGGGGTSSSGGGGGGGGGGMKALSAAADQLLADYVRSTTHFDGQALCPSRRKWKRRKFAASQGDQVAAKVTRTDENGSWILAYVLRFYPESETYDVQDEDDTSKLIRLPWNHVMRLSTGTEGWFEKGARVMAIFPETTSFYRAIISKQPTWTSGTSADQVSGGVGNAHKPRVKEVILKFEDDEDQESGKTPHRRVPSRYVIPVPQQYFYEDEDDVDLTTPNNAM